MQRIIISIIKRPLSQMFSCNRGCDIHFLGYGKPKLNLARLKEIPDPVPFSIIKTRHQFNLRFVHKEISFCRNLFSGF